MYTQLYIHMHFSDTSVHVMPYQSYCSYLEICMICKSNHDITKVYIEQWFRTHHSMLSCAMQTIVVCI